MICLIEMVVCRLSNVEHAGLEHPYLQREIRIECEVRGRRRQALTQEMTEDGEILQKKKKGFLLDHGAKIKRGRH